MSDKEKEMSEKRSALEAVAVFDRGEILSTVEMGGLGPGYEQCIQIGAIELIRKMAEKTLPDVEGEETEATRKAWDGWADPELHEVDREQHLQLSGAQAGAIKSLAYRALRDGWDAMVESAPADRRIQFSKHFPGMPAHA